MLYTPIISFYRLLITDHSTFCLYISVISSWKRLYGNNSIEEFCHLFTAACFSLISINFLGYIPPLFRVPSVCDPDILWIPETFVISLYNQVVVVEDYTRNQQYDHVCIIHPFQPCRQCSTLHMIATARPRFIFKKNILTSFA